MRLNRDCVRDVMCYLEENLKYVEPMENIEIQIMARDLNYEYHDVYYTLDKLKEAGYLNYFVNEIPSGVIMRIIYSITWKGHKFIDTELRVEYSRWNSLTDYLEEISKNAS